MSNPEEKDIPIEDEKELTQEEQINKLELKCKALEQLANQFKSNIPHILQIGRPVHLNLVHNSFIYQLLIPEHALSNLNQFSDAHAMLSKFGVMISSMEENAKKSMADAEAKKAVPEEPKK